MYKVAKMGAGIYGFCDNLGSFEALNQPGHGFYIRMYDVTRSMTHNRHLYVALSRSCIFIIKDKYNSHLQQFL